MIDVYGAYDWQTGDMYVGCGPFVRRVKCHYHRAENDMTRCEMLYQYMRNNPDALEFMKIKSFRSLKAARAYEKHLINKLQPSLNYQHNPKYKKGM